MPISRRSLFIGAAIFALASISLAYAINFSLAALSYTADQIDDARSVTAVEAAIDAMKEQLGATIRDNAYWDDAYQTLATSQCLDWAKTTWGEITANYPLYDTFMLLGGEGASSVGYHKGALVADPLGFFEPSVKELIKRARKSTPADPIPAAFIYSRHGPMIIGAAAVQPLKANKALRSNLLDVVIFGKELTPVLIDGVSKNFAIIDLHLSGKADPGKLNAPLLDVFNQPLYYFTWLSEKPGSKSFEKIKPNVLLVAALLLLLLAGVTWTALLFIRRIRAQEAAASHDAVHDPLTGLLNRRGLHDSLASHLAEDREQDGFMHLVDLDGFKKVNDSWGHPFGDKLLVAVAQRFEQSCSGAIAIARLGGDEFAIIHHRHLGKGIVQAVSHPFIIDERPVFVEASVGVVRLGRGPFSAEDIVREADVALYRAKTGGRARSVDFSSEFDTEDEAQKHLALDLRTAVERCQLEVAFQPIVSATNYRIIGVEALARWQHSTCGYIPPDRFIKTAEENNLIVDLGRLILCKTLDLMQGTDDVFVSVNISPLQLMCPSFVADVQFLLSEFKFDPRRLVLEVTEGVLISHPDAARVTMSALKELGIRIALDDFGCGYASIGALRNFQFDKIKLDRSLTTCTEPPDVELLTAVIAMATALNLPVTAEGIETEAQAALMSLAGCADLQGYYFGKPQCFEHLMSALHANRKPVPLTPRDRLRVWG